MRLDIQTKDLPPLRRGVFALGVLSLLFGVIACCAFSVFAWDRLKLVRSGVRAEATVTHSFVRATYGKEKQLMEFEFPLNDAVAKRPSNPTSKRIEGLESDLRFVICQRTQRTVWCTTSGCICGVLVWFQAGSVAVYMAWG